MKKVTNRFVRFSAPGSFFANQWDVPVEAIDPSQVEWPERAYEFRFVEREDVTDGDQTFTGKEKLVGPAYFHPDSKVETLEEVKLANRPADKILIANMEGNGWAAVVWSRWGNWPQPFDAEKTVVLPKVQP